MGRVQFVRAARLLAAAIALMGGVVVAGAPSLAMLDRFESGQWELRQRDGGGGGSRRCLGNGRTLIQLRHPGLQCRSTIIEDGEASVTVQYVCPGNGYGHTRIRLENPRLAQIETQGIANGLPFAFVAEARRAGPCRR
ncbi:MULTISPECIES: hypothetical protein [Novosphingobium]|uniref:hypothetical protein n=1 Tax=Novosphingobium TaxID=165696 RepID=UPI001CD2EF16|nr:hypothetical protein [Novosphingobium percolationis]